MTIMRAGPKSSAKDQTFSVWTSTPATPQTVTSAVSATWRAMRASWMKFPYPGVSRRLSLILSHSQWAIAVERLIFREISSASKSVVEFPSSTDPSRLMAPESNSIADVSEVLPEPPWPTRATLRMLAVS